jgi:hypothetical protein
MIPKVEDDFISHLEDLILCSVDECKFNQGVLGECPSFPAVSDGH